MRSETVVFALVAVTLGAAVPVAAQIPVAATDADSIMSEVDRRSRGWGDMEAVLRMEIRSDGDVRIRRMDVKLMEAGTEDRTLLELVEPVDLAGTAFLSIRRADGSRSQWIHLPSRRRTRRIGGAQSSDPFLGSHFTYGDLDAPTTSGHDFRIVRTTPIDGRAGVVIERREADVPDGAHERLWIDTEDFLLHRVEYFDAKGAPVRTLEIEDYATIDGFSRPERLVMIGDDGRTTLSWSDVRIGVGLDDSDFDPQRLGG